MMDFSLITDEPLNYCVYAHVNKQNGKMYIGITNNIKRRWEGNGCGYKHSKKFWNAIKKYGWNEFEHIVLIDHIPFSIACEYEMGLIKKYNTIKDGYNIAAGGTGGKLRSDPVYQYDLKGNFIRKWDDPSMAEVYYNITPSAISKHSKLKSINGYQWSFEYLEKMPPYETHNKQYTMSVYQYGIDGHFIKKWDYLYDAIQEYGIYVKLNAQGKNKTAYGFRWSFDEKECLDELPVVIPKPKKKKPKELLRPLGRYEDSDKVYRFNLNGELINIYDNCVDIYDCDTKPSTIYKLCHKYDNFVYHDSVWVFEQDAYNGYVEEVIKRHNYLHPHIMQYDLDGNFVKEYSTMLEIEQAGYSRTGVSNVCNHKNKTANGYQWRYSYDDPPKKEKINTYPPLPVIQKTLDGEYVNSFENAIAAARAMGKTHCGPNIIKVCRGEQRKAYGYLWEFADQEVN